MAPDVIVSVAPVSITNLLVEGIWREESEAIDNVPADPTVRDFPAASVKFLSPAKITFPFVTVISVWNKESFPVNVAVFLSKQNSTELFVNFVALKLVPNTMFRFDMLNFKPVAYV